MEKDTINYYLFFNKDNEVLMFYDLDTKNVLFPQTTEKKHEETYESKVAKLTMLLKEKDSSNDVLISRKKFNIFDKTNTFMDSILQVIGNEDTNLIDTYNGEYTLYEYSVGRFVLELDYLECNYYGKYIELTSEDYTKIKTLCETYNYEVDFVKIEDILNKQEGQFESSKRYIRKLEKVINNEK